MAISMELRERIVHVHDNGFATYRMISELFGCGQATVSRILRRNRENGSVEPSPHGGGAERKIDSRGIKLLKRWLKRAPDMTLEELTLRYNGCKSTRKVSRATIGRAVRDRLGLVRKKRPIVQPKGTGKTSV